MDKRHRSERFALVGLFLLAFLPRGLYPVSRGVHWYMWAARFFEDILHGEWADTLYGEHPGVMVMWLAGAALWGWYWLQSLLGMNPPMPYETPGYAFADQMAVAVAALALVIALGIVWGWHLLRRLFGRRVAWIGGILWALDPYYLTNSKALYLDATLTIFMWLSALWLLVYLREGRRRQLVMSAILGGLALLTKTPAVFLVPFLLLSLSIGQVVRVLGERRRLAAAAVVESVLRVSRDLLLWLAVVLIVYFALWPSLWVQPGESFDLLYREGLLRRTTPRQLPLLYRGVLGRHAPGVRYYVDVLLFRTTFLTLPFAAIGLLTAFSRNQRDRQSFLLIVAFGFFYLVQGSLASWKDGRYILPVFLVVDVLAAFGLIWWAERFRQVVKLQPKYLMGLLLAIQALLVLSHHPYYGTHYNMLAGGHRAVMRVFPPADFGEGIDLAGQYIDDQEGATDFVVGTQFLANEMLEQHVRATVRDIAEVGDDVDYLVFGVQYTMRGRDYPRWGSLWEQTYKFREPEFTVYLHGISYAWVHRPDAEFKIPKPTNVHLGEAIRLVGYRLAQDEVMPGDTLVLTLYWQAEEPVGGDYTVFVHLQGPGGGLVAQQDNPPARGTRPTSGWEPGVLVEDPYEIQIPVDAAFGEYVLSTGMYDPVTVERLEALGADGGQLPEARVVLAGVSVQPAVPWWRWALSGLWVVVVAAGTVQARFGRRR
jgi:hypothetical protein